MEGPEQILGDPAHYYQSLTDKTMTAIDKNVKFTISIVDRWMIQVYFNKSIKGPIIQTRKQLKIV